MAKALRVHTLAKELGVASKEIIAKCGAEGIELKNHMAAVTLGLAESIREWFSERDDVTSVEIAPSVDLEKVRTVRTAPSTEVAVDDAGTDVAVQELEPEAGDTGDDGTEADTPLPPGDADTTLAPTLEAPVEEPTTEVVAPAPPDAAGTLVEEEPPTEDLGTPDLEIAAREAAADEATEAAPGSDVETPAPAPPPAEPVKPVKPVKPAGPQVVPKPAELQGPRIVRVEAPERLRTPRPRPARPAQPAAGPMTGAPPTSAPSRKHRGRQRGASDDAPRGGRSPRRHSSSAEVGEREREWRDQDLVERKERLASATGLGLRNRRAAEKRRQAATTTGAGTVARKGEVEIIAPIVLKDFCAAIGVPFSQVVRSTMEHTGKLMMINQSIDGDTAELVALDLGITLKVVKARSEYEKLADEYKSRERNNLTPRPPVVAMLGHVDHGKTSLLDAIRNTDVVSGEAGGITQHIGASRIWRGDSSVTFLDTPGHEAFTQMRARGANLTDVVVLVVAADDGLMPQTLEAINHAKAAGVQIVVALNKIDLPGVDLNRIYAQLAEHDLAPAEWGGHTDVIKTSATTGEGVDDLLAHLVTLSELMELKADPTVAAAASVIEAEMREGQGVVARVLVQEGTLTTGQIVVCGPASGRVRSLLDHHGKRVKSAPPGTPVAVVGFDELPNAGDRLYQVDDIGRAKAVAEEVRKQRRQEGLRVTQRARGIEDLLASAGDADIPTLNVIVKADVQGSIETLRQQLANFPADKAELRVLHSAVGAITEADVALAQASDAIIIGFHVVAEDRARQAAESVGVEIRHYRVIYEILSDVHKALEGLLKPLEQEESRGMLEIRQIFHAGRVGTIAGCYVTEGTISRKHTARLIRDGRIVLEGAGIASLRRFKDDVREVRAGFECGLRLENYNDVKPGDKVEAYEVVEVRQQL